MSTTPFVGKIVSDQVDFKTIVMAVNAEDAKAKVIEKYRNDIGKLFLEEDIEVYPFF